MPEARRLAAAVIVATLLATDHLQPSVEGLHGPPHAGRRADLGLCGDDDVGAVGQGHGKAGFTGQEGGREAGRDHLALLQR
jgi:hypothetical protein